MSAHIDELHALLTQRPTPEHVAAILVAAGVSRDIGMAGQEQARVEACEEYRADVLHTRTWQLGRWRDEHADLVAALDAHQAATAGTAEQAAARAQIAVIASNLHGWMLPWVNWERKWEFDDAAPDQQVEMLVSQYAELRSERVDMNGWRPWRLPPTLGELADGYAERSSWLDKSEKFATHRGLSRPYASVTAAFDAIGVSVTAADPADAASLRRFVTDAWTALGVDAARQAQVHQSTQRTGDHRWKHNPKGARGDKRGTVDRRQWLPANQVRARFPGVSPTAWRRAAKTLAHLDQRTGVLEGVQATEAAVRFGKSRLAGDITPQDLAADLPTAAFVAYYTARIGGRTVFTSGSQARPMDQIAEELLAAAKASPGFRPDVVARVYTAPSILRQLTDEQLGELLGRYHQVMTSTARQLADMWDQGRDRSRMVVRRGENSSGWNMASRAFNQARTGWLSVMNSAGLAEQVAARLPGKVPALVAGDVHYWHTQEDSGQHGDLPVWAALPLPWDVLDGRAACTAADVEQACTAAGLDAAGTGWTQPYRQEALARSAATQALVHGVAVHSDELAQWLRNTGVFSGYKVRMTGSRPARDANSKAVVPRMP